jgi:hypothetical protein
MISLDRVFERYDMRMASEGQAAVFLKVITAEAVIFFPLSGSAKPIRGLQSSVGPTAMRKSQGAVEKLQASEDQ